MKGWLSAMQLLACTGQNLDESFISAHGVVLARIECHSMSTSPFIAYSAVMFLDGSVRVDAKTGDDERPAWATYERGEAERTHGTAPFLTSFTACGPPSPQYLRIEDGHLNYYICSGNPAAHVLDETLDVGSTCAGFNKGLFD
jgi:hypothetical protein